MLHRPPRRPEARLRAVAAPANPGFPTSARRAWRRQVATVATIAASSIAATVLLSLAGCATPMAPVADFGQAAAALATDYRPFVGGLAEACEQRAGYRALSGPGPYDLAAARREAARTCAPLREAARMAMSFSDALADYAGGLAHLAGTKDSTFDTSLRGVGTAVEHVRGADGSTLFPADSVAAADKLARAAAGLAMDRRTHAVTRAELEANHAALTTVVQAMSTVVTALYAGELRSTQDAMKLEYARLVAASLAPQQADVASRLPWRWAQQSALAELAANEAAQRRVAAFGRAAQALVAAHAALIDRFDTLDGRGRLTAVSDFLDTVRALRDGAASL